MPKRSSRASKASEDDYRSWISEIKDHLERLERELEFYQRRRDPFSKIVSLGIRMKIRYSKRQHEKMLSDYLRAKNRGDFN